MSWAYGGAFVFLLGLLWCREILGRFHSDLEEFKKTQDSGEKAVLLFFWVLTVPIMIVMAVIIWIGVSGLIEMFH
ncbi:MAG: hypothetical protein O7H41_12500 [Planctomycetota bacterium]|nr:hypothetical protein [Planctomycetota bacterium]